MYKARCIPYIPCNNCRIQARPNERKQTMQGDGKERSPAQIFEKDSIFILSGRTAQGNLNDEQGRGKQIKESHTCMWCLMWVLIKAKEIYMHIRDHKACLFGYQGYTYIHQQGNVPTGLCRLSRTRKDASVKEVLLARILRK